MRIKIVSGTAYIGALAFAAVIGAAFAVATVVTSPGASAQLPAIPQTLNGTTAEITVDGEPYDGTTPIEVLDQDGAALGTADVANGVWVFRVNEGPSETVIRIGLAVTDPVPFAQGALTTVVITAITPPLVVSTTVSLSAGFQALTDTGGALPIDDFLALFDSSEAVSGVFVWDRSVGNWASWRRGLPAPLQGVTQIGENTALLLSLDSAATYESEVVGHEAGTTHWMRASRPSRSTALTEPRLRTGSQPSPPQTVSARSSASTTARAATTRSARRCHRR